jgi:nicotinamide-nucleotide amidase
VSGPGRLPDGTRAGAVLDALVAADATVAVAESLTGGLLTAALTEPAGASRAVRGGLVVYATELKAILAGVPVPLLAAEGPVSPDVAAALAAGARDRLGATYGLGVTGVAGPDPQGGRPVGTVFVGLAGPGHGAVRELSLTGDRSAIRAAAVTAALDLLLSALRERVAEFPA